MNPSSVLSSKDSESNAQGAPTISFPETASDNWGKFFFNNDSNSVFQSATFSQPEMSPTLKKQIPLKLSRSTANEKRKDISNIFAESSKQKMDIQEKKLKIDTEALEETKIYNNAKLKMEEKVLNENIKMRKIEAKSNIMNSLIQNGKNLEEIKEFLKILNDE